MSYVWLLTLSAYLRIFSLNCC